MCRNDRRVLQASPEVLRVSRWLETRNGHYITYSLVLIAPLGGVILALANYREEAVKMVSAGVLVLATSAMLLFSVCGRSLLRGIDESLKNQQQKQEQLQQLGVIRVNVEGKRVSVSPQDRGGSDAMLLAARKKVKMVVIFVVISLVLVDCTLIFAMASRYGIETPLVLFVSPMSLVPPIWNIVNVTVHRGRTKLPSKGVSAKSGQSRVKSSSLSHVLVRPRSRPHQVVATETPMAFP